MNTLLYCCALDLAKSSVVQLMVMLEKLELGNYPARNSNMATITVAHFNVTSPS
jgi:hypothetical protein